MPFVRRNDSKQASWPAHLRKIFVGRTNEIQFFFEHILTSEEPTNNIISISGNGGVGKSTLIRHFIEEVRSSQLNNSILVALVDERQSTPASIMERFADQLAEEGYPLTEFEKALIQYKETLHRRLMEKEAAQDTGLHETVDMLGEVAEDLLPGGKILHKGVNVMADMYLKERRYRQQLQDAQWLDDPIGELTQTFVNELNYLTDIHITYGTNRTKRRLRVLLFFDTFEHLAIEAAPWLLGHFLQARISNHVFLIIAGRDSIESSTPEDPKRWLQYKDEGIIHLISLDSFTEEETRVYLAERGISNKEQVARIWHLSGGLPLYLSLLTFNPRRVVDPTADVVANFLRWIPEQEHVKRRLVLDAALFSRPFNQDDLSAFTYLPEQEQATFFRWLIRLPFIDSSQPDGRYCYHELVRDLFTLHLYQQSPKEYYETRRCLADYYKKLVENFQQSESRNVTSSTVRLEITLALIQQLFLLPDELSHFEATELIFITYESMKQAVEIARVLRELSEENVNNRADADTRQIAKALFDYIEADHTSQDQRTLIALSSLLEMVMARSSCPPGLLAQIYRERGIIYRQLNEYKNAIIDLDRAIDLDPEVAKAFAFRGSAYNHLKNYERSIADFDHAIELDPTYPRTYLSRGNAYNVLKNYEHAIADYTRAIELDPKYLRAYVYRGDMYDSLKDYQQAIASYNQALELDPHYALAYAYRGSTYRHLKDYQRAIADLDRAIELDPNYLRAYISRGNANYGLKAYEQAIADYTRAIELSPQYVTAYVSRGDAYQKIKDYQLAISDYDRALELDPKVASVYRKRGRTYRLLKDYQRAIVDYDQALELDSKYVKAYISRSIAYRRLKDYQLAMVDLNRALELNPEDAFAYVSRGLVYLDRKDYQLALADFSYALELSPMYADAYQSRGHAHRLLKDYQQAIEDLNRALELKSDNAETYLIRGETYLYLQEINQARADFLRAQELDSNNISIGWMVKLIALFDEGLSTDLVERLGRIAELDPTDYLALVCKGIMLWLNGSAEEAVIKLDQATTLEPDAYDPHYWKGIIFASVWQDEEAKALIKKALEMQLPPIMLTLFASPVVKRPDFYEKSVVSLLASFEVSR